MSWLQHFYNKDLTVPYTVKSDNDYRNDLSSRYKTLLDLAKSVGADKDSLKIIENFTFKIKGALGAYYRGEIASCYQRIQNLVKDTIDNDTYNIAKCDTFTILISSCFIDGTRKEKMLSALEML